MIQMQPQTGNAPSDVKKETDNCRDNLQCHTEVHPESSDNASLTVEDAKKEDDSCLDAPSLKNSTEVHQQSSVNLPPQDVDDDSSQSSANCQHQLVLYDPDSRDDDDDNQIPLQPEPVDYYPPSIPSFPVPNYHSRVLPSVGAFTVQCAACLKWRLIPTKEKYEEIRHNILQAPFFCETAREWRPDISCEEPTDISQDGSRIWAIDKPNISQPPPGWERLLRIRGEGSTRFADVYYVAPTGKRLRSMVEIEKFLTEHPEYIAAGVSLSQFSFQIPRPLQENYVRKRTPGPRPPTYDGTVNPIAWVPPPPPAVMAGETGQPGISNPYFNAPLDTHSATPPSLPAAKKRRVKPPSEPKFNDVGCNQTQIKVEGTQRSEKGACE
ncbi:Methyl-CpG-binding domain-containing protein 2 [Acorus gramineus]|uniref:Methyl-CpG-binding domain-containing protein 2 n=1 Tax=Acorus gramineus TaxID=55184 RepID=A0AAV9BH23_ACOGR|nr:Methyl-CpG-binding domain-containing protein 2 [Acorus gramineus]